MKNKVKFIFSAFAVILLTVSLFISVSAAENQITSFTVNAENAETGSDLGAVDWYKGADGVYYMFLPANTETKATSQHGLRQTMMSSAVKQSSQAENQLLFLQAVTHL